MSVTQRPSGKPRNASMINIKVNEYCGSAGKESTCNVSDLGSIPGLGRYLEEGKGYPLQYFGLENSMDYIVLGVTKSWTRLSDFHSLHYAPSLLGNLCLDKKLKSSSNCMAAKLQEFFNFE